MLSIFILSSCNDYFYSSKQDDSLKEDKINNVENINHSYEEVNDLHIFFSETFKQVEDSYYAYFYSLSCSHCASLKNDIIEFALTKKETIYFVKSSPEINVNDQKPSEPGVNNSSELVIRGYPTLLKIVDHILTFNIAGVSPIKTSLNIS